jgi:HD-GYP domain-containing protein (c-di-GMP phosphodiesterase class II)
MGATLRLADLLAGLSLVSDLGFAQPPEEAMRRCVVATALARWLGLSESEVADAYYTALLEHIGCTGFAHETSVAYGDELAVNAAIAPVDPGRVTDLLDFVRAATAGRPLGDRARGLLYTLTRGSDFGRRFGTATCEVGRETARRLGLGEGVSRGLHDVVETWNGKGGVRGLRGDDIALPARVTAVASTAVMFDSIGGDAAVTEVLQRRAGGLLDPTMAAAFLSRQREIMAEIRDRDPHEAVLAAEPMPVRTIPPDRLVTVAAAIGDVADLKSPHTLGHSGGVAALAVPAAHALGLDEAARGRLEVAALLHDVGRVGVSNSIWEKPGPLTRAEWEQVRLHPYHTERILSASAALRPVATIAGMHHERLDGSGYHRGARAREIAPESRILAAADAFEAMTHDRPHRGGRSPEDAASRLADEADAGRMDAGAVRAVVAAAGVDSPRRGLTERPGGLTEREVEVLRLVAGGLSNREIADRLVLSRRTAEHHVQHIYDKIGVSSRAAAALFAIEHALLD